MEVVANKNFRLNGRDYHPGESVDTSTLNNIKIGQLLDQRLLRPAVQADTQTDPVPAAAAVGE